MKETTPRLKDGDDYQISRQIVGDEAGLRNLIKACEQAIKNGRSDGIDLDDYWGVTKLDTENLDKNQESKLTPVALTLLMVLLMFLLMLLFLGFKQFLSWF